MHNQLGSRLGHREGRRRSGRLSPGERRRLPGRKERAWGACRGEDRARDAGSRAGYRWRFASASRSARQTLPATRGVSPGVSLGRESEPAAAGAAEGGGLCTRGRELENAVHAGGRLASGLGLRSATTEMPFLPLPEQSAPGRRARGYKWGGAAGRVGGRTRLPRVTLGEGGRKRLKASRCGGGGKGEEMEKSVSGEFIERGSEGRALQSGDRQSGRSISVISKQL